MKISLIVAMARNRVIGLNGQMPWHLSADLRYFKKMTLGSPLLMGRKTFEAIGRPLPGRENLIISRNSNFQPHGCQVFPDIQTALQVVESFPELFVIGGATLYEALLPLADAVYLTQIHKDFAGDTYFPSFDLADWREISRQDVTNDEQVDYAYSFLTLERQARL